MQYLAELKERGFSPDLPLYTELAKHLLAEKDVPKLKELVEGIQSFVI